MNPSTLRATGPLRDPETFIESLEDRVLSKSDATQIYTFVVTGVCQTTLAFRMDLWGIRQPQNEPLFLAGTEPQANRTLALSQFKTLGVSLVDGTLYCAVGRDTSDSLVATIGTPTNATPDQIQQIEDVAMVALRTVEATFLRSQLETTRTTARNTEQRILQFEQMREGDRFPERCQRIVDAVATASGADRAFLASRDRKGSTLIASSAGSDIPTRSVLAKHLCKLCDCLPTETFDWSYSVGDSPPENESVWSALTQYLNESNSRFIRAIRLQGKAKHSGWLVVEWFEGSAEPIVRNRVDSKLIKDASSAFAEAQTLRSKDLVTKMHDLYRSREKKVWLGFGLTMVALMIGLACSPVPFQIVVDGQLVARYQKGIYSPANAIVDRLDIKHGDVVNTGDRLLTLHDAQLDLEEQRLQGQLQNLQTRLAGIESAKRAGRSGRTNRERELSSEQSKLEVEIKGVEKQLAVIHQALEHLTLRSPISGQVNRYDLQQALDTRPVSHGQYLFDIFDPTGPWQLRLEIPDDLVGYVVTAHAKRPCVVSFRIRTDPQMRYQAVLHQLSNTSHVNRRGMAVVLGIVDLPKSPVLFPRSGASVIGRISCGKRSAAFVCFRELWEYWQRYVWI